MKATRAITGILADGSEIEFDEYRFADVPIEEFPGISPERLASARELGIETFLRPCLMLEGRQVYPVPS